MAVFMWTARDVAGALGTTTTAGLEIEFNGVSTDTRTIRTGDLFVALTGPRFDGNDYAMEAAGKGAAGLVLSRAPEADPGVPVFLVNDTLDALGRLARHRRDVLGAPVVAITGSSGKTGTKAFVRALVAGRRAHVTEGNLNNRVGLPSTILAAPDETELLVLEMGTNEPGEIAALTAVCRPDVAVLTTVSETHLDGLGSIEGVLDEKLDIVRGMADSGVALVGEAPADLPTAARALGRTAFVAGETYGADEALRAENVSVDANGCASFTWQGHAVSLRVPGRHHVVNALLALGVAEALDMNAVEAVRALGTVEAEPLRGERRAVGGLTLFLDCYNANPQSTRAALDTLRSLGGDTRGTAAVLGTMLELGDHAAELHTSVLADAADGRVDTVVATGDFAAVAERITPAAGVTLIALRDPDAGYYALRPLLTGDEVVLLKGSRGVRLEQLIPRFERDFGGEGA